MEEWSDTGNTGLENGSENLNLSFTGCPSLLDTSLDLLLFSDISGWIQIFICIFGTFSILCCLFLFRSIHLSNLFTQILLLLSVSHLLFLLSMLLSYLAKNMMSTVLVLVFPTVIHPLSSISLTLSIYLTMALSVHVYRIIHHPTGHGYPLLIYLVPSLLLSVSFNIPKFFETTLVYNEEGELFIDLTELRVSETYIALYIHWATLVVLGIFPFFVIILLTCQVISLVKKNRVPGQNKKHAFIFLVLVTIFITSHSLRLGLNMHEISVVDQIDLCAGTELGGFPAWIILTGFVSEIFLAVNSAATFLFYCLLGPRIKTCCFQEYNMQDMEVEMQSDICHTEQHTCALILIHSTG